MAVIFTQTKALLAEMANSLAAEATGANLTALSANLTSLSTEIITANSSITESEFFGGGSTSFTASGGTGGETSSGGSTSGSGSENGSAALVWINALQTAANIISAKNSTILSNEIAPDDSTTLKTIVAEIAQALENIQTHQQGIESHQQRMRELAEGTGIHMVGPYDWLGLVSSYIYYVNKGEILKTDENLSEADIARAFAELKTYFDKMKTLPSTFNTI
jgi:hypothetical protein